MLNEDSVEMNKYIQVEVEGGILATDFLYDFLWRTPAGSKTFYFIANEASVGNVQYTAGLSSASTLPSDFSTLLDGFAVGSLSAPVAEIMESVYFTPVYTVNESGNIYLPYTSTYSEVAVGDADYQEIEMFMVPVSTKFTFNFLNYRPAGVNVRGIEVSYINNDNFVFGNVGTTDFNKTIDGEQYYWVDWLQKVSLMSASNSGFGPNTSFNTLYGWIADYSMPTTGSRIQVLMGQEDVFTVPSYTLENPQDPTSEVVPGSIQAGPFYVAESENFIVPGGTALTTQRYFLSIDFEDLGENKTAPLFQEVAIENLQALFRNTAVIINISMMSGYVQVYSQIAPWNQQTINGWVTEGQAP